MYIRLTNYFQLAEVDAYSAGRYSGQIFVFVGVLAGVLKCWSISRRSTTNTKCALSLMFILSALLVSSSFSYLSQFDSIARARIIVIPLTALLFLGCLITGLILAILGLVEMSQRPQDFVQGRAQAIWALVLSGVFFVMVIIGVAAGLNRAGHLPGSNPAIRANQPLTFQDLNFRFRAPERPWVAVNMAKINKDAKIGFTRQNPEAYFLIMAEKIGADFSSEQLAELGKARLAAVADSSQVLSESPLALKGLQGVAVESEVSLRGHAIYYRHWYLATNGFAYQLIGYGPSREKARISQEIESLCRRFELLDTGQVATGGTPFHTDFFSPKYQYSVSVLNSPWHTFASLEKNLPEAEFGASRGDTCFAVIPVSLAGEHPDLESLTAGLLAMMGVQFSDAELKERKPYTSGALEGVQYDYDRDEDNKPFHYHFGILRGTETAYLLAAWTQRRGPDGEKFLADAFSRAHFSTGPKLLSSASDEFSSQERKTQAFVMNHAGQFRFKQSDYELALPLFRAAARISGGEKVYVINSLMSWSHLERPREALDFLAAQRPALLQSPDVRVWQAHFQAEGSLLEQALTNYAGVFSGGFRDEARFAEYVNLLNESRQFTNALAAIESYRHGEDSLTLRLLEAQTYRLQGEPKKAISLLKAEQQKAPTNSRVAGELVESSLAAGLFNDALQVSTEMANRNRDSAYPLFLKGKSELGLKWYREAKLSFEAAARLAPAEKTIKSYLEHVNAVMGEGDNGLVSDPLEPVALPSSWTNAPGEAVPEGYAKSYGAYYVRSVAAVSWEPGREHKTTESLQVHLLDASGVTAFSTVQWPFDPLNEQLFVNEVRVLDHDGNTVAAGKLGDYYVLDERHENVATHRKVLNVPVRGLQPGCDLVMTITRRELGKLQEFSFWEHTFSKGFPVRESLVLLKGDVRALKYRTSAVGEPNKLAEGLSWRCTEPFVVRHEPLQPPLASFAPMLWISDSSQGWSQVVTNYLGSISDRLDVEPAVAEQSRKLTASLEEERAKISALTAYVQTNFTYKAIEFGRRARVPNKAGEVLLNKYGDCKDLALLLQQMLEAAKVPAQLALVHPYSPVQQELPSLDQFNHMVVFVPGQALFLDPTDKGTDPSVGTPVGLSGSEALILDAQNPRFVSIRSSSENACGVELNTRIRITGEALAAETTLTARGLNAAYLRNYLLQIRPATRRMVFQQQMNLAEVEVKDLEIGRLDTPGEPLRLRWTYDIKKQFHQSQGRVSGVLRAPVERAYLEPGPVDNRLSPFELRNPLWLKSAISVELPEGWSAVVPQNSPTAFDPRYVTCTNYWGLNGRTLVGQLECHEPGGKFQSSEYVAFRETMARAVALLERELIFDVFLNSGK
jgi:tetratricopeptide (TPR) repeat protein